MPDDIQKKPTPGKSDEHHNQSSTQKSNDKPDTSSKQDAQNNYYDQIPGFFDVQDEQFQADGLPVEQGDMKNYFDGAADEEQSISDNAGECPDLRAEGDEFIDDCNGKGYSAEAIVRTVLEYKRDTQNFFVGNLEKCCNRKNRRHDDRWYPWTREIMERIDTNEKIIKDVLKKHSHAYVQALCKRIGGDGWNQTTESKLENMVSELEAMKNLMKSKDGMETIWGRMKYRGMLQCDFRMNLKMLKKVFKTEKPDVCDYVQLKLLKWKKLLKKSLEDEEKRKLYFDTW